MCNLHYVAMLMMTSQILKSVDFTKTQKSRYLENKTFHQMKNLITCQGLLIAENSAVAEVTLKSLRKIVLDLALPRVHGLSSY